MPNAKTPPIVRFAPSPTGHLHMGHAYSALLNAQYAAQHGGTLIVRIEDIDHTRCKSAFTESILDDLNWLELAYPTPIRTQSNHIHEYETLLKKWADLGLMYRCFKTRKDIAQSLSAPHSKSASYIGAPLPKAEENAQLAAGTPFAWRLSMHAVRAHLGPIFDNLTYPLMDGTGTISPQNANPIQYGDVILGRKDLGTSYHLSCVHDDALQNITHIIRGIDLADIAGLHALLFTLMGAPVPIFQHHPLVADANGKRLAKRDKSVTLKQHRQNGLTLKTLQMRLASATFVSYL